MPRENSFSDSDGRSLTPDLADESQGPRPRSPLLAVDRPKSPVKSHKTRSVRSKASFRPPTIKQDEVEVQSTPQPIERFRMSVRKVMHINRTSTCFSGKGPGAEPGVDVRRDSAYLNYGHIRQNCQIEIADYSSVRSSFGRMTNVEFINFLGNPSASEREPWVKVRWINVGGISWDVIRALALKYDLHPLALEDVLHLPGSPRSGVDYYKKHLFIRVLSHTLNQNDQIEPNFLEQFARSPSPEPLRSSNDIDGLPAYTTEENPPSGFASKLSRKFRSPHKSATIEPGGYDVENIDVSKPPNNGSTVNYGSFYAAYDQGQMVNKTVLKLVQELREGGRVEVNIKPVYIFLSKDGTVISIHPDNNLRFTEPIRRRLMQRDTGLRTTADASFLVHGILDLIVDSALEIIDAYQRKIIELEQQILLKAKMKAVRQLHIISGDLILHKRTLTPVKTLIYSLRRYDLDRTVALHDQKDEGGKKVEGYMTHRTTIYLADVHDHMEYILTSIEMFAGISENLINYSFNMSSHEMNEVMRTLTVVTVLFVPLTLLTGYFGMNFEAMWSVQKHSDLLFWEIAIPMMVFVIVIFFWSDFGRLFERLRKRMQHKKIDKLKQE